MFHYSPCAYHMHNTGGRNVVSCVHEGIHHENEELGLPGGVMY